MALHAYQQRCQCTRSRLPRSTALFLALVLPSSSFAQLTSSSTRPVRAPTTFSTSIIPSSTSTTPSATIITHVQSTPAPSNLSNTTQHAWNYYFLIIAGVVIAVSCCVLYIGRQKKRKAALIQSNGQRALARDIESWRSRLGVGRAGFGRSGLYNSHIHGIRAEDGLNERGEAPPPYVPGSKPPSISSDELQRPSTAASSHLQTEPAEMAHMSEISRPPGYNERFQQGPGDGSAEVTRPTPALTASERHSSVRRSTSSTRSPNGA